MTVAFWAKLLFQQVVYGQTQSAATETTSLWSSLDTYAKPQERIGIESMQCQMMRSTRLTSRLLLMSFSQTQNCECPLLLWRLLLFVLILL
jgi:hypothetical protein